MYSRFSLATLIMVSVAVAVSGSAESEQRFFLPDEGWTHTYRTSREVVGLRIRDYKGLKFRAEANTNPITTKNELKSSSAVSSVIETTTDYMDNNGLYLVKLQQGKTRADIRSSLSGLSLPGDPQYISDVFSPDPAADTDYSLQVMTTPYIYVSYVVPAEGGNIDNLNAAYGGTQEDVFDMPELGERGYLVSFPEDVDIFEMAELYALDPNVRAAAPEFLELSDPLAGVCPFDENPNPVGCDCDPPSVCGCECPRDGDQDILDCFSMYEPASKVDTDYPDDPLFTPNQDTCYYRGYDPFYTRRGINLFLVNAPAAWATTTGSNDITVGILDAGVGPHLDYSNSNDFEGVMLDGYDAVYHESTAEDYHTSSHGTSVAGIIAARRNNGVGVAGMAGGDGATLGCKILPVKATSTILNGDVTNFTLRAAEAIRWIANSGGQRRADVVNMSMGSLASSEALIHAVELAYEQGVLMVAAAHNHDLPMPGLPARYPEVIGVSGLAYSPNKARLEDLEDGWTAEEIGMHRFFGQLTGPETVGDECVTFAKIGTGSNYGPAIDVCGISVIATTTAATHIDAWLAGFSSGAGQKRSSWGQTFKAFTGYKMMGATSGATPHATGVAALLLSRDRELEGTTGYERLDPREAIAMLKASAKDLYYIRDGAPEGIYMTGTQEIAGAGRDVFTGYGIVDADAAVHLVEQPRFVIKNRDGQFIASFFSDGEISGSGDYELGAGYGSIDYGHDGSGTGSIPDSTDGGSVEGNAANGALVLRGRAYENVDYGQLIPSEEGDFIVRKADPAQDEDVAVARIDSEGNLYLAGRIHQYPWAPSGGSAFPDPAATGACFTLETTGDAAFAFFTSEGDLYLRGGLFESERPDPGHREEELVWHEDFEGTLESWTAQGNWTNTRFKQYGVTMTAGGYKDHALCPEGGCLNFISGSTSHTIAALGQLIIDTAHTGECGGESNPDYCIEYSVGMKGVGQQLVAVNAAEWNADRTSCISSHCLYSEGAPAASEIVLDTTYSDFFNANNWLHVDLKTADGKLLGGWANGWNSQQADFVGFDNTPNHYLTLNAAGTTDDYIERMVDLENHDGFTIDIRYQIAEDGVIADPAEDNPGLALELYEEESTTPVISAESFHYIDNKGEQSTAFRPAVDWNKDGSFQFDASQGLYERPEDYSEYNYSRQFSFRQFAPILRRQVVWYQIVILAQRDPVDGTFRVGLLNKLEGAQNIPVYWATTEPAGGGGDSVPFNPTGFRLKRLNAYSDTTHLRIDDITVSRLRDFD